jgi:GNAT superfamily N-acetyltransferase
MNQGWIDAIAVNPDHSRKGIGSELVNWAQTWLVSRGCKLIHLGGSVRPFVPGLPVKLDVQNFFFKLGFADSGTVWDVAHDLENYQPGQDSRLDHVKPLMPGEIGAMRDFLRKEFPDRWCFEFEEAVRSGDRLSDYQALWVDGEINGMVNLTFEDSPRPLERYYMADLPRPWGQLGTVGVSSRLRGMGFGALMMDSGLSRLKAQGVRGCVIDWTGLLDFYGKFGFKPFRQYQVLEKDFYL